MKTDSKVILSFDFEIGWGDVTNERWKTREREGVYTKLRSVLPEILQTMDDCNFPATWATVGAMFERPADRDFSHLPPNCKDLVHSVLNAAQADSFDGRDLFDNLVNSKTNHLIASHSYSHVPFTYEGISNDVIVEDMKRFNNVAQSYGIVADRFVFPENKEAHYSALAQTGYKKARVAADNAFRNRYMYLASTLFLPPPSGREEAGTHGVTRQFGSMLFNDAGQSRRIPLLKRRVALGLNQLERKGGTLHIWAHPFNFAESDGLKTSFLDTLKTIAHMRDKGSLTIELM